MTIKIKTMKNGKKRAYYWKRPMMRCLPITMVDAELLIASGEAERVAKFFWEA